MVEDIVKKHIEACAQEVYEFYWPKMEAAVAESKSPYDDMILAAVGPAVKAAIKAKIDLIYSPKAE